MPTEMTWQRRLLLQVGGPLAAVVLLVLFWDFVVGYYHIPRYVMPSTGDVWSHIVGDWSTLWKGMRTTFVEFLFGFVCGAGAGFIFAVLMDSAAVVRSALYPILIASQAVPIIAISAALTIWLGFGLAPKVVIVGFTVFFPVVVNVLDGLAAVDRDMINLAKSMGGSQMSIFRHIKLPATYTPLFSALKLSATFSVTGAVIGEWTASTSGGLGSYLLQANSRLNTSGTFAAITLLAVLGIASFLLVVLVEYILTPWRSSSHARRWSPRFWRATRPTTTAQRSSAVTS